MIRNTSFILILLAGLLAALSSGCTSSGGGDGDGGAVYSGKTTPATISAENATQVATSSVASVQDATAAADQPEVDGGTSEYARPRAGAHGTEQGYAGSVTYSTDQNSIIYVFSGFVAEPGAPTIDGKMEVSFLTDESDLLTGFIFEFTAFRTQDATEDFALDGTITFSFTPDIFNQTVTYDLLMTDHISGESVWLHPLTMTLETGLSDIEGTYSLSAMDGKIYFSNTGVLDVETVREIKTYTSNPDQPVDGLVLLKGVDETGAPAVTGIEYFTNRYIVYYGPDQDTWEIVDTVYY